MAKTATLGDLLVHVPYIFLMKKKVGSLRQSENEGDQDATFVFHVHLELPQLIDCQDHNGHFGHGIKGAYELPTEALQKSRSVSRTKHRTYVRFMRTWFVQWLGAAPMIWEALHCMTTARIEAIAHPACAMSKTSHGTE
jgi:hypothetical protein